MMNKRYIISGALIIVGLLLIFGAVGEADFSGGFEREFIARAAVGLLLIFAAVPVSGDLDIDPRRKEKTAAERKFSRRQRKTYYSGIIPHKKGKAKWN